jgi:hypothetical protein
MKTTLLLLTITAGIALSGACGTSRATSRPTTPNQGSTTETSPPPAVVVAPPEARYGMVRPSVPGLEDYPPEVKLPDERGNSLAVSAPDGASAVEILTTTWQKPNACGCLLEDGTRGYCTGDGGKAAGEGETALCRTKAGEVPCTGTDGEARSCPVAVRSGRCEPDKRCESSGCSLTTPLRVAVYSGAEPSAAMPTSAQLVTPTPADDDHALYRLELAERISGPAWVQVEFPRGPGHETACLRHWQSTAPIDVGRALWCDGETCTDFAVDGATPSPDQAGGPWYGATAIDIE